MRFELMDTTSVLLLTVEDAGIRDDVALTYAMAISSRDKTDWRPVNEAIRDRWSQGAVEYIKRRAWKLIDEKEKRDDQGGG